MEATGTLRSIILGCIRDEGALGLTCDALELALDMRHQTASARVRELFQRGLIRDSGVVRPTRSGRNATVWVAV